jgi:uncharacterized membrane protein
MILLALHVLVAFAAVAFLVVPGAMLVAAANSRDVPFIRRAFAVGAFHGRVGGPLLLLAGILGIALAIVAGIPLGSRWLVASYVVYALLLVIGTGYHARWEMRVARLAHASPDNAPSPELAAAIADPLGKPMLWVSAILWIAIVYLMVAKPGF